MNSQRQMQGPNQFQTEIMPQRLPLVINTENRDLSTNKDAKLVNCYAETYGEEIWIIKRPGLTVAPYSLAFTAAGAGVYFWKGDIYTVFAAVLYRNGVSVSAGLDSTNGVYQFTSNLGATPKLILGNGVDSYAYDTVNGLSANFAQISGGVLPSLMVKGFAFLNGAIYLMDPNATIWGSAIDSVTDPTSWDALDFLQAQMEPDDGVALSKQLAYVIAFNQWSTEVFNDVGNATGSPLKSVQQSKINYGCASADSIQNIDDRLVWLANTRGGSPQVMVMQGLQVTLVSTKFIDKLIAQADLTTVFSWQLKFDGHSFYVLTIKSINLTIAYDIAEDKWHQWTDSDGNYFPIVASAYDGVNKHILQHETNGQLYYADQTVTNDNGTIIMLDVYTPNFDAKTTRRKHLSQMMLVADTEVGSTLLVRSSDDDYQTWSNYRYIDMSKDRPTLTNCGTFVRRAYNFHHESDTPLRLKMVELQYDVGTL